MSLLCLDYANGPSWTIAQFGGRPGYAACISCGLLPLKGELCSDHRMCGKMTSTTRQCLRKMYVARATVTAKIYMGRNWQFGKFRCDQNIRSFKYLCWADGLAIVVLFLSFPDKISPSVCLIGQFAHSPLKLFSLRISLCKHPWKLESFHNFVFSCVIWRNQMLLEDNLSPRM